MEHCAAGVLGHPVQTLLGATLEKLWSEIRVCLCPVYCPVFSISKIVSSAKLKSEASIIKSYFLLLML